MSENGLSASLPISIIICTKNEQNNIEHCLSSVAGFEDVIVVDSGSQDKTTAIAQQYGAKIVQYRWDGRYPKKRQWCLENLNTRYDWVFFLDADETITDEFMKSLYATFTRKDLDRYGGFFVKGRYIWKDTPLNFGLKNNKLCLLHKNRMRYPVINDLGNNTMGEMEGHYQPVPVKGGPHQMGSIDGAIDHHIENFFGWVRRHYRYAVWEDHMNTHDLWLDDPVPLRQSLKSLFRAVPCRSVFAFMHSYIFKLGFLDGKAGLDFAKKRALYYKLIRIYAAR